MHKFDGILSDFGIFCKAILTYAFHYGILRIYIFRIYIFGIIAEAVCDVVFGGLANASLDGFSERSADRYRGEACGTKTDTIRDAK